MHGWPLINQLILDRLQEVVRGDDKNVYCPSLLMCCVLHTLCTHDATTSHQAHTHTQPMPASMWAKKNNSRWTHSHANKTRKNIWNATHTKTLECTMATIGGKYHVRRKSWQLLFQIDSAYFVSARRSSRKQSAFLLLFVPFFFFFVGHSSSPFSGFCREQSFSFFFCCVMLYSSLFDIRAISNLK